MAKKIRIECGVFNCKKGYEADNSCCCFCKLEDCNERCKNDYRKCKLAIEVEGMLQELAKRPKRYK